MERSQEGSPTSPAPNGHSPEHSKPHRGDSWLRHGRARSRCGQLLRDQGARDAVVEPARAVRKPTRLLDLCLDEVLGGSTIKRPEIRGAEIIGHRDDDTPPNVVARGRCRRANGDQAVAWLPADIDERQPRARLRAPEVPEARGAHPQRAAREMLWAPWNCWSCTLVVRPLGQARTRSRSPLHPGARPPRAPAWVADTARYAGDAAATPSFSTLRRKVVLTRRIRAATAIPPQRCTDRALRPSAR